ncbi:MAG: EAL domain-containing protein [Proteobacteria bacterium]|nr:EAL domain-containing protein [Pseudomonadota bacterium]
MELSTHKLTFKKGQRVFKVGDEALCAYIVESGTIDLYAISQEDELIASLSKGELLGEMGVIDKSKRSVSAFAATDLELLVIDREQITKRLEKSDPIIRGVMEVLLRRIRNMLGTSHEFDEVVNHPSSDDNSIVTEGLDKIRFEKELHQALEKGDINNVYQPMVCLKSGKIAGFEALSRWNHPEKGMVSPFEFITLAEESDLIKTMGLQIFDSACKQLAEFQKARDRVNNNLSPLFMSINVSAAQLTSENFFADIFAITKNYNIDPANIKIEITESLVVDYKKVKIWIDDCRNMGFKLSLDDFGTGYSGFQHLLELDFHTIKIDQAFTLSIETNPKSLIMLEVITDMANRMNMSVVAEGIEDLKSANKLKSIGVDYAQGYYFFKPMQASDVCKFL